MTLAASSGFPATYLGREGCSQSGLVRAWLRSATVGFTGGRPASTHCSNAVSESHAAANAGAPALAYLSDLSGNRKPDFH